MTKTYLNTLTTAEIIARLKKGEVIKIDGTERNSFKMIDGVVCSCYENKAYIIGSGIDIEDNDYFFEDKEPFKITKTGKYRTKDGRIVFISLLDEKRVYGVIEGRKYTECWYPNGQYEENSTEINLDLVEYVGD